MSLMEHLHELRRRVFLAVLAIFLGTVVGFIWFSVGIPVLHIPPLIDILIGPYCSVPAPPRVQIPGTGECQLLATGPFSILQLRLTAAIMAGVLLSCPVWLHELWAYVGPALYSKEKKFALGFTSIGASLFVGGMVLAYLVIPEALKVLLGFGAHSVAAWLDAQLYFKLLIGMMLIFGMSLELPLLLVMLNFAGVLKGAKLAQARRYACFGLIVFAGIAVPGNDPISMGVLALTLCILYEAAVQVAKAHDRRKGKAEAASFANLSDEEASPLEPTDYSQDGTSSEYDIGTPEPVAASGPLDDAAGQVRDRTDEDGDGHGPASSGNPYSDVT